MSENNLLSPNSAPHSEVEHIKKQKQLFAWQPGGNARRPDHGFDP